MNQPMGQQPTPYKTDQKKPETQYEVEENGDVKITQTVTTTSWWKVREFLSLQRQNEKALEDTRHNYSEEFIEKMKEQEREIESEIAIMQPVREKAEELAKKEYEKLRHEGLKSNLIKALGDKELNIGWWQQVWLRAKDEIKKPILEELDAEQKNQLAKVIQKLKRKGLK
jgi:dipeptidase